MYVYTVWLHEDDDTKEVVLDGNSSEFGLDELIESGNLPAEEVRKCIVSEFPAGGDDEEEGYTVLKYVKIIDENDDVVAEINYE